MNYSQHEAQSAHVAQPEAQSPQVQVVQHTVTQQEFVSATSTLCGAKLKRTKIAEKRMMDFIIEIGFKFLKNLNQNGESKNALNPKSKILVGTQELAERELRTAEVKHVQRA